MTNRVERAATRPYELGRRLDQMDENRAAILHAARVRLESEGFRQLTMASLALDSGVSRQTVHNLFGTKTAVLEALFDVIALDGGMEQMRRVMSQRSGEAMLREFVTVFCGFWAKHRVLIRRIHGVGAIDPEFGAVIEARNRRRFQAARRIAREMGVEKDVDARAGTLAALTSFEFFDALAEHGGRDVVVRILELAKSSVSAH